MVTPEETTAVTTAAVEAIQTGDVRTLEGLLREHAALAATNVGPRSLLHIATDWPGHFPNNADSVRTLIAHGAGVNARFSGPHTETPLHWAASSDDVAVLDVLLDAGADIEASGAVIGGGTPLADAVAFGQWNAARRLRERGAQTTLWQAAALGLMDRLEQNLTANPPPGPDDITNAFWCACHGGQRPAAEYLLARGADLNWIGHDKLTPFDAASRSGAIELGDWLRSLGAKPASELF